MNDDTKLTARDVEMFNCGIIAASKAARMWSVGRMHTKARGELDDAILAVQRPAARVGDEKGGG